MLFQRKIFFISYLISIVIGVLVGDHAKTIGIYYLVIAPIVHYWVYDIHNKNVYYFYFNLGLDHLRLWTSTFLIALLNLLILSFL